MSRQKLFFTTCGMRNFFETYKKWLFWTRKIVVTEHWLKFLNNLERFPVYFLDTMWNISWLCATNFIYNLIIFSLACLILRASEIGIHALLVIGLQASNFTMISFTTLNKVQISCTQPSMGTKSAKFSPVSYQVYSLRYHGCGFESQLAGH